MKRTPKNYDGVEFPEKKLSLLLPEILDKIQTAKGVDLEEISTSWVDLLGSKMVKFTKPVSFVDGVLKVLVSSSALYSLLVQHEKPRLLAALKERYPKISIRDIVFRMH